ncbi:MAG: hypothetical protein ABI164_03710, partial [Acidobacteriaceae bacterium]
MSAPQQQPTIPPLEDQGPDWKRQLAERLDAYRSKHPDASAQLASTSQNVIDSRASRIARSVASRYAAAPTYSDLFAAAEAERIAHEAHLAQEEFRQEIIAQERLEASRLDAERAASIAQQNLLADEVELASQQHVAQQQDTTPVQQATTIQPGTPVMPQFAVRSQEMHAQRPAREQEPTLEDLWASALVEPRSLLPSKLIEFPRELISAHRARPRLPESPEQVSAQAAQQPESAQLRIFEVQPDTENPSPGIAVTPPSSSEAGSISRETAAAPVSRDAAQKRASEPAQPSRPAAAASTPSSTKRGGYAGVPRSAAESSTSSTRPYKSLEWAAISLDKEPASAVRQHVSVAECVPFLIEPASIEHRLMAFAVDFSAVTAGFLAFLLVFAASTPH